MANIILLYNALLTVWILVQALPLRLSLITTS
jgi:hypothetical protein